MLKKTMFCLFGAALFLVSGSALFAQKDLDFTGALSGVAVPLPEGTKVELQNAAELTPEELQEALETSSCTNAQGERLPTHCFACTALNCGGTCYAIPCQRYINANQQVPPPPGFKSFAVGCRTTYVSACNDLSGAAGCGLTAFPVGPAAPNFPDNTCINYRPNEPTAFLQSVGCLP